MYDTGGGCFGGSAGGGGIGACADEYGTRGSDGERCGMGGRDGSARRGEGACELGAEFEPYGYAEPRRGGTSA